ncbi:hypothetical protein FBUS_08561 [Fasciolopsis buskii]|uniref:Uncharacterized protein n=1 Tax=Fasciolopsis buskii TaxID=27845 RepID=A0A8E0S3N3_9TREM|nr:hypothetical protein FBUS_08561 [Fasciolopsis buski]
MVLIMEQVGPLCFRKNFQFLQQFDEDFGKDYTIHSGYYENLLRDFYGKIHTKKSEKSASLCRDLASFICLLKCSDTLDDQ